ncbi:hypothetical protein HELRODRAFT_162175 [Helobdella robusta]|uniref:Uncharacterized protein n=1 Tax=Helobdella robusta TaxID=6412 RepID=T1ESB7_HELRO|nr:hypothetical protein HELRODRAFT_162175 [Helobdella robusta]ESN98724.1 hypothetical protein HELRODRAFT_162175 [Helobdella robusta]
MLPQQCDGPVVPIHNFNLREAAQCFTTVCNFNAEEHCHSNYDVCCPQQLALNRCCCCYDDCNCCLMVPCTCSPTMPSERLNTNHQIILNARSKLPSYADITSSLVNLDLYEDLISRSRSSLSHLQLSSCSDLPRRVADDCDIKQSLRHAIDQCSSNKKIQFNELDNLISASRFSPPKKEIKFDKCVESYDLCENPMPPRIQRNLSLVQNLLNKRVASGEECIPCRDRRSTLSQCVLKSKMYQSKLKSCAENSTNGDEVCYKITSRAGDGGASMSMRNYKTVCDDDKITFKFNENSQF